MNKIKISVIIPVYNTEIYLRQCIESVLNQTLREIEIICIDDASTDASSEIIKEYSQIDDRFKGIFFTESKSALVARKKGVEEAQGDYILFLDSDDYIEKDTCKDLYNKILEEKVEILQFNSVIENCANISENRIKSNEKILKPYCKKLENEEVFNGCFRKKYYSITLWNKIFSSKLCKKAFKYIPDSYLPKAQDLFTYFVISFFAKSYLGWDSKAYYHYCFGRGVTGSEIITIDIFKRYCMQVKVVDALNEFSVKMNINDDVQKIIENYFQQWINECVLLWHDKVNENDLKNATEILFNSWNRNDLLKIISKKYYYQRSQIAENLKLYKFSENSDKPVKTVGIYYYRYTIGGVQRVIMELIKLYQEMGYNVVLITDEKYNKNEFPIDNNIDWININNWKNINKDNIKDRIDNWIKILKKYDIDMLVYHAWTSPLLLWDILALKLNGSKVVVHTHSVFSYSMISYNRDFSIIPKVVSLADGVITLSKVDKLFWKAFNDNVVLIQNPIDKRLVNVNKSTGDKKIILWVGRFSNEKQPWEAIKIIELVAKVIPDAMLYMIGDGDNNILEKYQKNIINKHLENNIKLLGFQNNVYEYYEQASVYLLTSVYEGFPMTILEAKAHGLPIVMYKMPFLENAGSEEGVLSTKNYINAAQEIIDLLGNNEKWKMYSDRALNNFRSISDYDYLKIWNNILSLKFSLINYDDSINEKTYKILMNTIIEHYRIGWEKTNNNILNLKKFVNNNDSLSCARKEANIKGFLYNCMKLFPKVKNYYKNNGLKATIKKCKEKIMEN